MTGFSRIAPMPKPGLRNSMRSVPNCCLTHFHRADIEQPLIRRKLIKPTDLCPKQAKNFHLYSSEAFDQVMDLALHGHAHAMNPFEELEHPTQGGPFCRLVNLVRQRLVLTRQVMAQSALRHRIDQ